VEWRKKTQEAKILRREDLLDHRNLQVYVILSSSQETDINMAYPDRKYKRTTSKLGRETSLFL